MFLGHFSHKLDDKGRLSIPAKFREVLGNGAYLTQGFDRNLRLLTEDEFQKLKNFVNGMNQADPKTRKLRRFLFANASRVEFDRNGRIMVVKFLQDFAGIVNNGHAVIVGVGDEIEVWSPESWAEEQELLNDVEANAQQFSDLDLSI
jgi:MraZ protein